MWRSPCLRHLRAALASWVARRHGFLHIKDNGGGRLKAQLNGPLVGLPDIDHSGVVDVQSGGTSVLDLSGPTGVDAQ